MEKNTSVIYDKNTVEFVTVAAECCGFLEQTGGMKRILFIDKALKLFSLLYLKALLLPEYAERMDDFAPEAFVTESDYNRVRADIAAVMREYDDYLDVFLDDMVYSETPIRQTVSESLADIYQPLKDFVCIYRTGFDPAMNDALVVCREQFGEYWGQRLLNTLRALHDVKYRFCPEDGEEEESGSALSVFKADAGYTEADLYKGLEYGEDED